MCGIRLTALMTVRNGEPYLERAVQSILNQSYEQFKFLILDNASTDRSREIVHGFRDSRIQLVELGQDIGQTQALNRGLEMADTAYIARLDADDIAHPERFERQMQHLSEHPEIALLGTWFEIVDADDNLICQRRMPVEHNEILKAMLFENPFSHTTVVYSREVVMACGGYDTAFKCAQDYALWWRIASSHEVAILPGFLARFRSHPGQSSRSFKNEVPLELLQIVRDALQYPSLPEEVRGLAGKALAYADLKYAAGISEAGHAFAALFWLIRGILRRPSLVSEQGARNNIARALRRWPGYATMLRMSRQVLRSPWREPILPVSTPHSCSSSDRS